jgi:hypothetical protein
MDAYSFCPGGCGKKIKFCCGADVLADLEKLDRMIEGEQRRACIEHIAKMPEKFRDRPCVLLKKITAERMAGDAAAAEASCRDMLARYPDNVVALALVAPFEISEGRVSEGLAMVHRAIAAMAENPEAYRTALLFDGLLMMCQRLLAQGYVWAARGHLRLLAFWLDELFAGSQAENPAEYMLSSMDQDASLPVVWKDDPTLPACPADAPFKSEYTEGEKLFVQGRWVESQKIFETIAQRNPASPVAWDAAATNRTILADDSGAAEAYRKYAALDVPADDAVIAELYAIALDSSRREQDSTGIDLLKVTVPIDDYEGFMEKLTADKRVVRMRVDLASMARENEPPPLAGLMVLDRETPAGSDELRREDVPRILAEVLMYGRETDRPARAQIIATRDDAAQTRAVLAEIGGPAVDSPANSAAGAAVEEEVVTTIPAIERALAWRWRIPEGVSPEHRTQLEREEHRHRMLEVWPQTPCADAGGKTFAEAARDPATKRVVQATILDLESNYRPRHGEFDFNELRTKLGLPIAPDVDPFKVDLHNISLLKLGRLPVGLLSEADLLTAFNLCIAMRIDRAGERIGSEMLKRSSFSNDEKSGIYAGLARLAAGTPKVIEYLQRGREADAARGKSPAPWLLQELANELANGTSQERIHDLMAQIMARRNEPGVAQQLMQLLVAYGVIDPNTMYQQTSAPTMNISGFDMRPQTPTIPGAPAETAAPSKSGLWLPGMD